MSEQVATATPMEADGAAPATETKEEAEPVPEDGLDVLLLMPGFAGGFDGPRAQYLRSMGLSSSSSKMCDVNAPPQWKNLYTKNEPEAAAAPPPEMAE
ncbi:hypothetical protein JL720_4470 [Aureococcus anophagefferens]|nr:hypothetical protein JL720_4470 [Aureococcus anophagefferens]